MNGTIIRISYNGPVTSGQSSSFSECIALAERSEFANIKKDYPELYLRYKWTLENLYKFNVDKLSDICGIWQFGPPGSGKDYSIYSFLGDSLYVKSLTKSWDGYSNEKHVLIGDVEPFNSGWLGYYLKIWANRYPFMAKIKGASMQIHPLKIVVTSNK